MSCSKPCNFGIASSANLNNWRNQLPLITAEAARYLHSTPAVGSALREIYNSTAKLTKVQYELLQPFFAKMGKQVGARFVREINEFGLFARVATRALEGSEDPRNFEHLRTNDEGGKIRHASIKRYAILLLEYYGHELDVALATGSVYVLPSATATIPAPAPTTVTKGGVTVTKNPLGAVPNPAVKPTGAPVVAVQKPVVSAAAAAAAAPVAVTASVHTAFASPKNTLSSIMSDSDLTKSMSPQLRRQLDMLKLQLDQAQEVVIEAVCCQSN